MKDDSAGSSNELNRWALDAESKIRSHVQRKDARRSDLPAIYLGFLRLEGSAFAR